MRHRLIAIRSFRLRGCCRAAPRRGAPHTAKTDVAWWVRWEQGDAQLTLTFKTSSLLIGAAIWMLAAWWGWGQVVGAQTPMVIFYDALDGATKGRQEGGEFVQGGGWRAVKSLRPHSD